MTRPTSVLRGTSVSVAVALLAGALAGCSSKSKSLEGVYHQNGGGPSTLTIKDGKATMTIGTESKTMDYKVDGNKLTLVNPKEGDVVFTINDDGSLNSEIGTFQKNPS